MVISELRNLFENSSHHAFLIIGDHNAHYNELRLFLREKVSVGKLELADIWSRSYEAIGIDDAREIKEIQNTRPNGERRVVLLSFLSIQSEAQNSLLKLFEEPMSGTIFIVCARSPEIFLPTLLSRFYVIEPRKRQTAPEFADSAPIDSAPIDSGSQTSASPIPSMPKFLSGTIQERLALLEPIIKEKDKNLAEGFLNALELVLYDGKVNATKGEIPLADGSGSALADIDASIFEDIFSARRFLRGRSPSVKMILEHFCGVVPIVSGDPIVSAVSKIFK